MEKFRIMLDLLSRKYVLDTLMQLRSSPTRYTDLEASCPSSRLRSMRLKGLQQNGLVQRKASGEGENIEILYSITEKGSLVLEEILKVRKNLKRLI